MAQAKGKEILVLKTHTRTVPESLKNLGLGFECDNELKHIMSKKHASLGHCNQGSDTLCGDVHSMTAAEVRRLAPRAVHFDRTRKGLPSFLPAL